MPIGHYDHRALALAFATQEAQAMQSRAIKSAMTPRQLQLNYFYGFYAGDQYANRVVAWNGLKVPSSIAERDGILRQPNLLPGFYDQGGLLDLMPLEYRKPDAEQHVVQEVVNGVTDLMFGDKQTPQLSVDGDDQATAWLADMIEACSFWQRWTIARNWAGAMGSVGLTFKFVNGRLIIEVHDPRWCNPTILDQATGDCSSLEIRYIYPVETRDERGNPFEVWHWYRRVIDRQADTTYMPAVVSEKEPLWVPDPERTIAHQLGVFPGVWVQNTEAPGRTDGDPDCKSLYDNIETGDRLLSQAASGAVHNADPTLHVGTSDQKLDDIRKGSKNAIRTEVGGAVEYVEMSGGGTKAAMEVFELLDKINLRAARYVRLHDQAGAMTAEEVRRRFGPMISAVGTKRTHWTQTGIVPLTEKIIRVTRTLSEQRVADPTSGIITETTVHKPLPGRLQGGSVDNQNIDAAADHIRAKWPEVVKPTATDAQAAATAASAARGAKILDLESAVEFIAPAFNIDDTAAVVTRLEAENAATAAQLESELLAGAGPAPGAPPPSSEPTTPAAEALNSGQIEQLKAMAADAYNGVLPRDAILAQARLAFPTAPGPILDAAIPQPKPVPVPVVLPGLPGPGAPPPPGPPGPTPPAPPPGDGAPPAPGAPTP